MLGRWDALETVFLIAPFMYIHCAYGQAFITRENKNHRGHRDHREGESWDK